MSESCNVCLKQIQKNKSKVHCNDCSKAFHPKCANLSPDDLKAMNGDDQIWRCSPCSAEHRQSMVIENKSNVNYEDVINLFSELKSEFKKVEQSLGVSLNACHEELIQNSKKIEEQKSDIAQWMKKVEELTSENIQLRKKIASLEVRVDDAEQYSRSNTIEIHGIPIQPSEDVTELVKSVGEALDYPIENNMIDVCHRLGYKDRNGHPPGIIVKMVRRTDSQKLLAKRRENRNFNTNHIGLHLSTASTIYINESLSPARRKLFNAAKKFKSDKNYTFLWVRGGKIFMKKDQQGPVNVINSVMDLEKL